MSCFQVTEGEWRGSTHTPQYLPRQDDQHRLPLLSLHCLALPAGCLIVYCLVCCQTQVTLASHWLTQFNTDLWLVDRRYVKPSTLRSVPSLSRMWSPGDDEEALISRQDQDYLYSHTKVFVGWTIHQYRLLQSYNQTTYNCPLHLCDLFV